MDWKDNLMKCGKCGTDEWYERGNYKRCRECHREATRTYHRNKKLGVTKARNTYQTKELSQGLGSNNTNRRKTVCVRGHDLTPDTVRLDIDNKGRTHRRCRQCEYLANYKKYNLPLPGQLSKLIEQAIDPWELL